LIKWANVAVRVRTEEDFYLLSKLLSALGFEGNEVETYTHLKIQPFYPNSATLEIEYRKKPFEKADLELTIFDPDSAIEILRKHGFEIIEDSSGPEPRHAVRDFLIQLPGGTKIVCTGFRTAARLPDGIGEAGSLNAHGKSFAIVVSRFNSFITERLFAGALDGLNRCGADRHSTIEIVRVPGAFEIPSAARTLAETKKYDAIICIGCLLRGDTAHYDVIVNEVTRGIGQSAQETGVPHAFGVLTCDTLEQAIDRAGLKMGNKGFEAALAAVEMANLKQVVGRRSLVVGKGGVRRPSSAIRRKQGPSAAQKKSNKISDRTKPKRRR